MTVPAHISSTSAMVWAGSAGLCAVWWRSSPACASAASTGAVLPAPVEAALARAQIPCDAVSVYIAPVEGRQPVRLAWQSASPMNPASVMKLVTTYVAGSSGLAYVWCSTPVYLDGCWHASLCGTVYIKGSGDPAGVRAPVADAGPPAGDGGVKAIAGDIVIDRMPGRAQDPPP